LPDTAPRASTDNISGDTDCLAFRLIDFTSSPPPRWEARTECGTLKLAIAKPLMQLIAAVFMGAVNDAAAFAQPEPTAGPGSLVGLWTNGAYRSSERYSERERILLTTDGKMPPLLPKQQALLEQRLRASEAGKPFANSLSLCLPGGVPQMLFGAGAYPIQILETPGQVTMLIDEQNHFRIVPLGHRHKENPDPSYFGDSVGHWEDGALIVDTIGLTERTTLDQIGMPHSEELHVVERYRRTAADLIEVLVTIDDPKTFSATWQAKALLRKARPDVGMDEYICENNRNLPDASGAQGLQAPSR
jgi:hypothetical protein